MLTRRAMLGQAGAAAGAAWAMRAGVAVAAAGRTAVDFDVPARCLRLPCARVR